MAKVMMVGKSEGFIEMTARQIKELRKQRDELTKSLKLAATILGIDLGKCNDPEEEKGCDIYDNCVDCWVNHLRSE